MFAPGRGVAEDASCAGCGAAVAPGVDATPPFAGAPGRAPPAPLAMSPLVVPPDAGGPPCRAPAGTAATSTADSAEAARRVARRIA
ncbi:MAG: hypothetical protein ACRYGC_00575 [Janthinobacterium lividum]